MGAVFFLAFALFIGFIGFILLVIGLLCFRKHKVVSIITFIFSGICFLPTLSLIVIVSSGIFDSIKYDREYLKENGQLNYEIYKGHEKKAISLVENGADINRITANGLTPLMEACSHNQKKLVEKLLEKDSDPNMFTEQQAPAIFHTYMNDEITLLLIEHGADVNARDKYGRTPLIIKCMATNTLKLLIENGAVINAKDDSGWTALHKACDFNPKKETVAFLIANGADLNATTSDGDTPLMICVKTNRYIDNERKDVALSLLENKADVKMKNKDGKTFIDYLKEHLKSNEGKPDYEWSRKNISEIMEKLPKE